MVYFHYPRFCKKAQLPLKDIPSSPLHMLPPITQLIPDIPIFYDDDGVIPGLAPPSLPSKHPWVWLACCGAFFLVHVAKQRVFSGTSLVALVAHFLRATNRTLVASGAGDSQQQPTFAKGGGGGEACAPHAHIEMPPTTT